MPELNFCGILLTWFLFINLIGPPQVGEESYESYIAEKEGILSSLARRAKVSCILENSAGGCKSIWSLSAC